MGPTGGGEEDEQLRLGREVVDNLGDDLLLLERGVDGVHGGVGA